MSYPGPWAVCIKPANNLWYAGLTIGEARPGGRRICDMPNLMPEAERKSNAALIVRAPEMQAALEEVLEYLARFEDVVDGDYGEPQANEAMNLANMIRETLGLRP